MPIYRKFSLNKHYLVVIDLVLLLQKVDKPENFQIHSPRCAHSIGKTERLLFLSYL